LRHLPSLKKLRALKRLDLSHTCALEKMPQGMESLSNLRFLRMMKRSFVVGYWLNSLACKSSCGGIFSVLEEKLIAGRILMPRMSLIPSSSCGRRI